MDAPKCRSCGERHWGRMCPGLAGVADTLNRDTRGTDAPRIKAASNPKRKRAAPVAVQSGTEFMKSYYGRDIAKRRQYMRELMAKRRHVSEK